MNDTRIISGVISGNESAINYAINKYSKLMWHIAGTVLKNVASSEDIEECVADVFIYLWKNANSFDEQRGNLKSWLSMVAKSKAIDRYRQLSKAKEVSLNDEILMESMGVLDNVLSSELKLELIVAINSLGEPDKEIIVRRYYYQQKPKEISFVLGLPVKHIENRLYRSKLKMREIMLSEHGGCQL